jgi:hypothetical protein
VINPSHHNIKSLTKKLSALFNVKLKNSIVLSAGASDVMMDEKKAFFDDQFKIIMKRIKESRS